MVNLPAALRSDLQGIGRNIPWGRVAASALFRANVRVATDFIFGRVPDGTGSDPYPTSAIQAAIDDSPGAIFVPSGVWSGAAVNLKDGTHLIIERGATGVTVSVGSGVTGIVEDLQNGITRYYSGGTLRLEVDGPNATLDRVKSLGFVDVSGVQPTGYPTGTAVLEIPVVGAGRHYHWRFDRPWSSDLPSVNDFPGEVIAYRVVMWGPGSTRTGGILEFCDIAANGAISNCRTVIGAATAGANIDILMGGGSGVRYVGLDTGPSGLLMRAGQILLFDASGFSFARYEATPNVLKFFTQSTFGVDTDQERLRFVRNGATVEFFDDFLGNAVEARWNQAAGTWATQSDTNGSVRGTTGAVQGNTAELNWNAKVTLNKSKNAVFEARVKSIETTDHTMEIGLKNGGTDYLRIRRDPAENSGNWQAQTSLAGSPTSQNMAIAFDNAYHVFRIFAENAQVRFYLDGTRRNTITTTLPTVDLEAYLYVESDAGGGGGAKNLDVDYVKIWQDR